MTPKKKARKAVKAKIRDIIRSGGATPVTVIVDRVNAAVAGWSTTSGSAIPVVPSAKCVTIWR